MPTIITPDDLTPFAEIAPTKAAAMIEDAMADASRVAPCINDDDLTNAKAAQFKSVLRAAILRWNDSGSGALSAQTAGPFGQTLDTRVQRKGMYWPSEIESLQDICRDETAVSLAFSIDTVSASSGTHSPVCSLYFGATYCSCGSVLTGNTYPLYEV